MALEDLTGTKYIDDLVATNPAAGDNVSEGDDHIRGIKNVLKTTFPNIDGAVTPTDTEINYVGGVTSAIQTQINTKAATTAVVTKTSATGSGALPAGTTGQRDGSPSVGFIRFNTTDTSAEIYDGSAWTAVGGGNTTDKALYEHSHTISANYSITSGNNALTASPITINSGVSVTIPTGSTWVIA